MSTEERTKEYMQDYIRLLSWEKHRLEKQGYDVHFQERRIINVKKDYWI